MEEEDELDYGALISDMIVRGKNHISVDLTQLYNYNSNLVRGIMQSPDDATPQLASVILEKLRLRDPDYADKIGRIHICYENVLDRKNIYQTHLHPLYTLLQVTGVVIQIGAVMKRPLVIAYKCPLCKEITRVPQNEQWRIAPEKCIGCDNRKGFIKAYEETSFSNYQWIEIQELVENTPPGETPATVRVLLKDHLAKRCTPGEVITVAGAPKVSESSPNTLKLEMDTYIDAFGVTNNTENITLSLTEDDKKQLHTLAANPNHLKNTIESFAPTVYGENEVKEALIYQQCEGVERQLTKQKRRRGQIHILLAGPFGVAKSDLGECQARYHTKGRHATGRGTSSVGLTASVVQVNDEWVLKAGAMALADRGLLFVDEIEKMRPEDSGAMHPGMEAQEIPISKAGINATIKTRCSIVAACNPVEGTWNDYKTLSGNLIHRGGGLTQPLLNRFALIFVMRGKDKVEEERKVVEHILNINEQNGVFTQIYDEDTLRKLFAYARTLKPRLTHEASQRIEEFYLNLFTASKAEESIIISRRQIEDMIRISEASAKLHLREEVTAQDADNATRLLAASLKQYGVDPDSGKIDQSKALYTEAKTMKEKIAEVPVIIKRLTDRSVDSTRVSREDFVDYASKLWKIDKGEVGRLLDEVLRDGMVYRPSPGFIAVT